MKSSIIRLTLLSTALLLVKLSIAQTADTMIPAPPYQKAQLDSLAGNLKHVTDPAFAFFVKNSKAIDAVMGADYTKNKLEFIIFTDKIQPAVPNPSANPDWSKIEKEVKPFGSMGREIYLRAKMTHYQNQGKWAEYVPVADAYWHEFPTVFSFDQNNRAWDVFNNVNDKRLLTTALKWAEKVCAASANDPSSQYLDTYANLLYKLGRKDKAIAYEEQALLIAKKNKDGVVDVEATLQKMRSGQATWTPAK